MSFIQENIFLIIGILLVLIIIEGLIIFVQHKNRPKSKGRSKSGSSGSISKEKYKELTEKLNASRSEANQLKVNFNKINNAYAVYYNRYLQEHDKYAKASLEIGNLRQTIAELEKRIRELTRDNDELNKLVGNEPAPNVAKTNITVIPSPVTPKSEPKEVPEDNTPTKSSQTPVQEVTSSEVVQETKTPKEESKIEPSKDEPKDEVPKEEPKVVSSKDKTMYASFPRTAGSSIYFSDLSENLVDDSYFELKISIASGKATFKPLDFMKIRNYDPAMVAMFTEGVKPNVASTVLGVEPGKAHIEGKDWIIDNPAKIKLA